MQISKNNYIRPKRPRLLHFRRLNMKLYGSYYQDIGKLQIQVINDLFSII